MKLEYSKIILVGFAFFLIQAFWQSYDAIVPLILVNKYGMNQTISGLIMGFDNMLALFMLPLFGALSDKTSSKYGRRKPYVFVGTLFAICFFIGMTMISEEQLWLFIVVLLLALIAMATFRSPAVALMPDVTCKPHRSKGNAVINLMGTAGAMIALGLGALFKTGVEGKTDFTAYVIAIAVVMVIGLVIFLYTVKEIEWSKEMEENTQKYFGDKELEERVEAGGRLSSSQLKSLIFILVSVALWFTGYNAIISKYSLYAPAVLKQDYNLTLLIAQAAAIISYVPVGILANKIGRRKSILIGVTMLAIAFGSAAFIREGTPVAVMWILFSLAGIAWATINVNSFPMVVELAKGSDVGKYTGYYYTASMLAQVITPFLSGLIMDAVGNMTPLFPYATVFVVGSLITMLFVKHGDAKPVVKGSFLENFDVDEE